MDRAGAGTDLPMPDGDDPVAQAVSADSQVIVRPIGG